MGRETLVLGSPRIPLARHIHTDQSNSARGGDCDKHEPVSLPVSMLTGWLTRDGRTLALWWRCVQRSGAQLPTTILENLQEMKPGSAKPSVPTL